MLVRPALAALPLLLLTACGTGPSDSGSSSGSAAGAATASASDRTVATAFGDVEVPAAPQRVVSLGETSLDTLLALGVQPVGALSSRGGTGLPPYLAERAGDVPIVGTVREPNLEEVVKTGPDLIVAGAGTTKAQYDALSALAPTVVPDVEGFGDWETETRTVAAAVGKADEAERLLADVDARAAALKGSGDTGSAAVVRWMPTGPLVMSGALMAGQLLEAAGSALPPVTAFSDKPHTDPLSLESLGDVDVDRLWVATLDADGRKALDAAMASPAFRRLGAVASGGVEVVDGGVWSSAAGPLAADAVLDDLERAAGE